MQRLTLFLMLGYPGAGKTTTAMTIKDLTGAVHLWADHERSLMFKNPLYSHKENLQLYKVLNAKAEVLLASGKSVIFDTNFSFYKDRQKLRRIAARNGADCYLIWVVTPKEIAKQRATAGTGTQQTRVFGDMPESEFERMSRNIQTPKPNEAYVSVDGTRVNKNYLASLLPSELLLDE